MKNGNVLLAKEFHETFLNFAKIPGYLFSLGIIAFIFWNLSNAFSSIMIVPNTPFPLIIMLAPSYLICLFSIMLIRDFAIEKKTGVIEALLSTGIRQQHIITARSYMIFALSLLECGLSLIWLEVLIRLKTGKTLIDYIRLNENIFIILSSVLFAWIFIKLLTALALYYNSVVNYALPISFSLIFFYAGFVYCLKKFPFIFNFILILVVCFFLLGIVYKISKTFSTEKLVME